MLEGLLTLLAQAMFGRVQPPGRQDMLEQPLRRRLYQIIHRQPGIHASELCRASGEPWGTVQYHLTLLGKGRLVTSLEAGRERRFFPPSLDPMKARLLAVLGSGRRPEIAECIHQNPGIRQVDVCKTVRVSRKTFRASILPLVEAGLVVERKGVQTNTYYPTSDLETLLEQEDALHYPERPPEDRYDGPGML